MSGSTRTKGLILICLFMAAGCVFRTNEQTKQIEARSLLRLTGNASGTEVVLAGQEQDYRFDGGDSNYAIEPGNYRLTISRGEQVVVDRRLYVADGETREVRVP